MKRLMILHSLICILVILLLPIHQTYGSEISLFGALGGWEPDSSTVRGWQGELRFGGLNSTDLYLGSSYADKYFFTRYSYSLRGYFHYSQTGYLKVGLWKKSYDYPVAVTPVPDSNAYKDVPSVEVEIGDALSSSLRGSLSYEYIRPNFFFDPSTTASNHKVSAELQYQSGWKPLQVRFLAALLKDPDPNTTLVDKVNQRVSVDYSTQALFGGGADLAFSHIKAGILFLPNRDLDRSFDYSVLSHLTFPVNSSFSIRGDEVYDHYSTQSVFSGSSSQISTLTLTWKIKEDIEVSAGGKIVVRPILNESGGFLTARWSLALS